MFQKKSVIIGLLAEIQDVDIEEERGLKHRT